MRSTGRMFKEAATLFQIETQESILNLLERSLKILNIYWITT